MKYSILAFLRLVNNFTKSLGPNSETFKVLKTLRRRERLGKREQTPESKAA